MEDDVVSKPLTAEERRQRRMKKILENSESRMSTILSGPDGDEKRNAPAMEGGEAFNIPPDQTVAASETQSEEVRNVPPQQSSLFNFVDNKRRLISFFFGILCRLVMLFVGVQANILLPWILVYVTTEFVLMRPYRTSNSLPDELQALLRTMSPGSLPINMSYILSGATLKTEMWKDTTFMAAGFLWTQYAMVITDFYL